MSAPSFTTFRQFGSHADNSTSSGVVNFFVIILGFTAVMAVYANNVRTGDSVIARCGKSPPEQHSASDWVENSESSTIGQVVVRKAADTIMKTPVRLFLLVGFAVLLTFGFIGADKIETGFPLTDILPTTSYVHSFLKTREAFFGVFTAYVIFGRGEADTSPMPYWNLLPELVEMEQRLSANIWTHPFVNVHAQSWVDDFVYELNTNANYKQYLGDQEYHYIATDGKRTLVDTVDVGGVATTFYFPHVDKGWSKVVFDDILKAFISGPGILNGDQFSFGADGQLVSIYIPYLVSNLFEYNDFVRCIETTRENVESFPYVAYPGGFVYNFYTQVLNVKEDVFAYTGGIAAAVAVMSLVFLYDPRISILFTVVIIMLVIEVYGICYYIDLKINAIMSANLVLAVGLGVEFTAHIARVFMISQGTRVERALAALYKMGLPILYGGLSTFVGILFIAFADFPYFKLYFFEMYVAIIFIGLGNGLLLLPVVLSFIGPPALVMGEGHADARRAKYGAVKTKYIDGDIEAGGENSISFVQGRESRLEYGTKDDRETHYKVTKRMQDKRAKMKSLSRSHAAELKKGQQGSAQEGAVASIAEAAEAPTDGNIAAADAFDKAVAV
jgi:predicted RND superfamily exporter protein